MRQQKFLWGTDMDLINKKDIEFHCCNDEECDRKDNCLRCDKFVCSYKDICDIESTYKECLNEVKIKTLNYYAKNLEKQLQRKSFSTSKNVRAIWLTDALNIVKYVKMCLSKIN